MKPRPSILFLCTANCCRSQMAEAILKHLAAGRFEVFSAGAYPAGYVHPLVYEALEPMGIPVEDQHSKSWEEFRDRRLDLVITLCDAAAAQVCPLWPQAPSTVHWPLPDPVTAALDDDDARQAAGRVAERLALRLQRLTTLDWANKQASELTDELRRIGEL